MSAQDCPQCGLVNPASAQVCDCGYDFDFAQGPDHRYGQQRGGAAKATIAFGLLFIFGGAALSIAVSEGTDGITVFHGAIVVGIITVVRGLLRLR